MLAGPDPSHLQVIRELRSERPTQVALEGFAAGSQFFHQCQFRRPGTAEWLSGPPTKQQTRRAAGVAFRVALIADSHVYRAVREPWMMENLRKTVTLVLRDAPDFVVFLGDEAGILFLLDPPGYMNPQRACERWELWRSAFAPLLSATPVFVVLGNHEGEAGFYQRHPDGAARTAHLQRWGTVARKRYCLNPLPDTYPEGGEDEGWRCPDDDDSVGGGHDGNCSPLQNYYAWSWGDALFVVLDVHRHTNPGGGTPRAPEEWTLGAAQLRWLERTLTGTSAAWKFVIAHHLVGGYAWDLRGSRRDTDYVYGRGGARYARVGEQARVTDLMLRHGARFFLYGHDHVFAHQQAEGLHFVCCGRPTFLQPDWWRTPGWHEAYGDVGARNPHDFHGAIGYTRLSVAPTRVQVEYVRSGTDATLCENTSVAEGEVTHAFAVS